MGEAVLAGLLRAGWQPTEVRVHERDGQRMAVVAAGHGVSAAGLDEVSDVDVVVLAVKPGQLPAVLGRLSPLLVSRPGPVVVSIAAGVPTRTVEAALPDGVPVVRVMPNTPALVGAGVSVLSPGRNAGEDHLAAAERVMSAVGSTHRVPEELQDAVTAVSGSGPAYVFYLVDAMAEAGALLGLDRGTARELAVGTVLGAARLLAETGRHPVELREQVSSPAGTTMAALRVLDQRAVRAALLDAITAARDRSTELGEPGGVG
jgi:pyrroline-5-carboxylate reductase